MTPQEALAEALDDVLTLARINGGAYWYDNVDTIASQVLSNLGEFGWVLSCDDEAPEPATLPEGTSEVDVFDAIAKAAEQKRLGDDPCPDEWDTDED